MEVAAIVALTAEMAETAATRGSTLALAMTGKTITGHLAVAREMQGTDTHRVVHIHNLTGEIAAAAEIGRGRITTAHGLLKIVA